MKSMAFWTPVGLAAALRILLLPYVSEPPASWLGDSHNYLEIAKELLAGRIPPIMWVFPPGYPLAGIALAPLGGVGAGLIAASLLSGVLCSAIVLRAGRTIGLPVAGFVAALVLACQPDLLLYGVRPYSESTSLLFVMASAVCLEVALRHPGFATRITAGLLGGLGVLTRPENLLAAVALAAFALVRGPTGRRAAAVFMVGVSLVVLPYVVGLRVASGVWSLTLKPYIAVNEVYRSAPDYVEGRVFWDTYWEQLHDDQGRLEPRALVESLSLRSRMKVSQPIRDWRQHVAVAAHGSSWGYKALWALGLLGLLWPSRFARGRVTAVLASLPLLVVLFVHPPTDRFFIPALPALAWGTGLLAEHVVRTLAVRRKWTLTVAAVLVVPAIGLWAWTSALAGVEGIHWTGRWREIQVRATRGKWDAAETITRQGMEIDPNDPRFVNVWGYLRESQGDLAGAREAYLRAVDMGGDPTGLRLLDRRLSSKGDMRP